MDDMKNLSLFIANPDRANIFFYQFIQRPPCVKQGSVDEFDELLSPIAEELIVQISVTIMTIIYS